MFSGSVSRVIREGWIRGKSLLHQNPPPRSRNNDLKGRLRGSYLELDGGALMAAFLHVMVLASSGRSRQPQPRVFLVAE